jgi:hypothetical protein
MNKPRDWVAFFKKATPELTIEGLKSCIDQYMYGPATYKSGSLFYGVPTGREADRLALEAGERLRKQLRSRNCCIEDVIIIYHWKNGGSRFIESLKTLFESNSSECIEVSFARAAKATKAKDVRAAITSLCDLKGVQVRTASAFLTCIYPEIYAVMDTLALRAVGFYDVTPADCTVDLYCSYLNECRKYAAEFDMTLRNVDRAFVTWGANHPRRPDRRDGPAASPRGGELGGLRVCVRSPRGEWS